MIFIDISAAFESVSRFFVLSHRPSDEELALLFSQLNFLPAAFQEFVLVVISQNTCLSAGVPARFTIFHISPMLDWRR